MKYRISRDESTIKTCDNFNEAFIKFNNLKCNNSYNTIYFDIIKNNTPVEIIATKDNKNGIVFLSYLDKVCLKKKVNND